MRHLVIGAGEVGRALAEVLDCDIRDIAPRSGRYDILHIAFPWSDRFVENVKQYVAEHDPRFVVVHSSVPVGTCDAHGWTHSPVRGRHPQLAEGVRTFVTHFGGVDADLMAVEWVARTGGDLDRDTLTHTKAATTEALKDWELAAFAIQVAFNKRLHAWCRDNGVPFEEVYTEGSETYNAGYERLGEERFIKPVLTYVDGPIGGHCIQPAIERLDVDWLTDMVKPFLGEGGPAGGTV